MPFYKAADRGGCEDCQNLPKERYAMEKTTTVVPFRQVDSVDDPLTEIAREGARRMLAVAMGVEADAFVAQHSGVALPDGRQRVVRHGHGPMRRIQTGVGPLEVQRPKVRDRADVPEAEKIRFNLAEDHLLREGAPLPNGQQLQQLILSRG